MNPQRLVAALAALAIGFGVTLVGVGLADDETVVVSEGDQTDVEVTQPSRGGEAPEQDAEPAQEPAAAEVDETLETTTVGPPPQQGEDRENTVPPPDPATTTSPPTQPDQDDPGSGDQVTFPGSGIACVTVLRLEYDVGPPEFVVVRSELSEEQFLVLDELGEDFIDVRELEDVVGIAIGERLVEFVDGLPVAYGELCQRESTQPAGGKDVEGEPQRTGAGQAFPCSADAFENVSASLSNLERTELTLDRDIFLTVIAKRLAAAGSTPQEAWSAALGQEFESFAEFPDGCPDDIEAGFTGNGSRLLCSAARISNDDDLFEFFVLQARPAMVGCSFDDEKNQGGL